MTHMLTLQSDLQHSNVVHRLQAVIAARRTEKLHNTGSISDNEQAVCLTGLRSRKDDIQDLF